MGALAHFPHRTGTAGWGVVWLQPQQESVCGHKRVSPMAKVLFVPDRTEPRPSDTGGALPESPALFGSGPLNK